jgi:hypothetical protein
LPPFILGFFGALFMVVGVVVCGAGMVMVPV